jgi:hypothetical protein
MDTDALENVSGVLASTEKMLLEAVQAIHVIDTTNPNEIDDADVGEMDDSMLAELDGVDDNDPQAIASLLKRVNPVSDAGTALPSTATTATATTTTARDRASLSPPSAPARVASASVSPSTSTSSLSPQQPGLPRSPAATRTPPPAATPAARAPAAGGAVAVRAVPAPATGRTPPGQAVRPAAAAAVPVSESRRVCLGSVSDAPGTAGRMSLMPFSSASLA